MPPLFRRWFVQPGSRWVLVALLGLVLLGAQTLAGRHELSHLFGGAADGVAESVAVTPAGPGGAGHPASTQAGHECPLCLLAAALGGTAAGPQGLTFAAAEGAAPGPHEPESGWTPRLQRAYASRAPPLA